jgi:hypothetical protein
MPGLARPKWYKKETICLNHQLTVDWVTLKNAARSLSGSRSAMHVLPTDSARDELINQHSKAI